MTRPRFERQLWLRCSVLALGILLTACRRAPEVRRQTSYNPPSRGFIDAPAEGSSVGPQFVLAGWVIDESGVQKVRIYLDDKLVGSVALSVDRPDIDRAFPAFAANGPRHGFDTGIDAGSRVGYCTIRLEAIDGRGALTRFANVNVTIGQ